MTRIGCGRTVARLTAAGGALALALAPTAAFAVDPVPVPSVLAPVTTLLSPSPSPSAGPLDPVVRQLPSPVRELVTSVTGGAPATPVTPPKPAPGVKPNTAAAPQAVAAPRTRVAAPPALRGSTFATGRSTSGLPRLGAGTAAPQLAELFSVPDVATPVVITPQAAAPTRRPAVPAGLPALAVLVAAVTLGGAATAHVATLRSRRSR